MSTSPCSRMNWRALLAIAERAGWKRAAWKAVRAIEEVREATDPAIVVQLLSDIRGAFDRLSTDRMTSKTLLAELARDEEGPWLSYGKGGKLITDRQLSRLLRGFNGGFPHPRHNQCRQGLPPSRLRGRLQLLSSPYLGQNPVSIRYTATSECSQ
jgi:hypothetical protein